MNAVSNTKKRIEPVPYIIIGALVLFAAFIGYLVYGSVTANISLVSDEYYQEELKYQQHIEKLARSESQQLAVRYDEQAGTLSLQFPENSGSINGNIVFYRPSDARLDFEVPLQISDQYEGKQVLSTAKLAPGYWKVKINWEQDGKAYYKQSELTKK